MKGLLLNLVILSVSTCFAEEPLSDSQFELDHDLVNSIYQGTLYDEGMSEVARAQGFSINAEFAYVTPTDLNLSNQYFDVHYGENVTSMPSFRVSLGKGVVNTPFLNLRVLGSAGYGRKESLMTVTSKLGGEFKDLIQLNWVPLNVGLRAELSPFSSGIVRPFLEFGAGVSWLYQTGKLDKALEQGYWIPFYRAGTGLVLFGNSSSPTNVFGGVTLGASLMRGFGSEQKADAWSLDAGVSLVL